MKKTAKNVWNGVKKVAKNVWNGVKKVASTVWNGAKAVWNAVVPSSPRASSSWGGIPSGINYVGNYGGRTYYPQQNYAGANYIRGRNGQPVGYQTYSQALYYQSAAYRHQVQVQRAQATRMMATVRIKKVCDTADKKWTGRNSGLVVGTAFVIPIPRVPVVPPVTTIPKPDLDTGNFSFPSLPKVPSAQDLANGIVRWFIGDYIQKIAKDVPGLPKQGTVNGDIENAPPVDAGKQGKHVPGHNNSIETKTQWKKGQTGVNETQEGWIKGKLLNEGTKVWDTGKVIGPNGETGVRVHIDGAGRIHGYPVNPKQYLK